MSYQISLHLLEIFLCSSSKAQLSCKRIGPHHQARVKETSIQLGPTGKAVLNPLLRVYVSPMKVTWVSKKFRTSLPIMPNGFFLTLLHYNGHRPCPRNVLEAFATFRRAIISFVMYVPNQAPAQRAFTKFYI